MLAKKRIVTLLTARTLLKKHVKKIPIITAGQQKRIQILSYRKKKSQANRLRRRKKTLRLSK